MPRTIFISFAMASLLAVSCGVKSHRYDAEARAIVQRLSTPDEVLVLDSDSSLSGCILETVRDEYGFVIEIQNCEETTPEHGTVQAPSELLTQWVGSPEALAVVAAVRQLALADSCSDPNHSQELLGSIEIAAAALEASDDLFTSELGIALQGLRSDLSRLVAACGISRTAWTFAAGLVSTRLNEVAAHIVDSQPTS
jgi:hypothetical protein